MNVELAPPVADPVREVLSGRADVALVGAQGLRGPAVESLTTLAVLPREDPRDVLLAAGAEHVSLTTLPQGARLGVHGSRRRAFLRAHRRDVEVVELDSETPSASALQASDLDAVIMGALEARRMGVVGFIREVLDPKAWLPAPGQGAVALVSRHPIAEATALDHLPTRTELRAELALSDALDAPPDAALGSLAQASGRWIRLWAALVSDDGQAVIRSDLTGPLDEPGVLGAAVAGQLGERGAAIVLAGSGA